MFKYYYSSTEEPFKGPKNEGLQEVESTLNQLSKKNRLLKVDTSHWNHDQRFSIYGDAIVVAVMKKSKVRKVFGTNRHPGTNFGKEVPALVLYNEDDYAIDVYPRMEDGEIITIKQYLDSLEIQRE